MKPIELPPLTDAAIRELDTLYQGLSHLRMDASKQHSLPGDPAARPRLYGRAASAQPAGARAFQMRSQLNG